MKFFIIFKVFRIFRVKYLRKRIQPTKSAAKIAKKKNAPLMSPFGQHAKKKTLKPGLVGRLTHLALLESVVPSSYDDTVSYIYQPCNHRRRRCSFRGGTGISLSFRFFCRLFSVTLSNDSGQFFVDVFKKDEFPECEQVYRYRKGHRRAISVVCFQSVI